MSAAVSQGLFMATFAYVACVVDDMELLQRIARAVQQNRVRKTEVVSGFFAANTVLCAAALVVTLAAHLLVPVVGRRLLGFLGFVPFLIGAGELLDRFVKRRARRVESIETMLRADNAPGFLDVFKFFLMADWEHLLLWVPLLVIIPLQAALFGVGVYVLLGAAVGMLGVYQLQAERWTRAQRLWQKYLVPVLYMALGMYIIDLGGVFG